jgi:hypothetical protein
MTIPTLSDQYSMEQQRAVLSARRKAVSRLNGKRSKKTDTEYFETLREVSPLGLRRCLVQRNKTAWVAAYLIQRIGQEGYRYLVPGKDWKIFRSRRNAEVVEIHSTYEEIFDRIVNRQQEFLTELQTLLESCRRSKKK